MISIWYPAAPDGRQGLAPYMQPEAARHFKEISVEPLGLAPEAIDVEGVRTHAWSQAPADISQGTRPVLLYSPGGSQPRTLGTVLVEELASRGYVVVTMDHTYEANVVAFPGGRVERSALPEGPDTLKKMIEVRVADVGFVLSQLERIRAGENPDAANSPIPVGLADVLDLSRIGMFGHSAGGFTTVEVMLEDSRIDAGVNLDGSLGYRIADGDFGVAANRGLDRPFMLLGAGLSGRDRLPHTHEHAPDWRALWEHSPGWKLDVYLPEGEHFSFTDHQVILPQIDRKLGVPDWLLRGMIGTIDPESAVASTRAYLLAFFNQHLWNTEERLLWQPSPHHPFIDFSGLPDGLSGAT